ncbi:E3 ubiquitin-protein ligase trul-1-like [Planococcus citri]|uniref:E3 ubiquitin-protein ligase trul-1-like n=1 Tax=Planococcus citri TaxID=170843 RepID=UPI0031F84586
MNVSCTICQEDLFTGDDGESISSTSCGHVYHSHCLLQWMERSKTCPYCRTALENDDVFKLNVLIEKASAVPSTEKFDDLGKHVKRFRKDVESDLKTAVERRVIVHSKCNEFRNSANELERLVLHYLSGDTESKISKELLETSEKLKAMESDYKRAELAGERLRTKNKKLEDRVQSLLHSESSVRKELVAKNTKLQEMEKSLKTANLRNEKLEKTNEELERRIERDLDYQDYLKDKLDIETEILEKTKDNLFKANLTSEKLKKKNEELENSIDDYEDDVQYYKDELIKLKWRTEDLAEANLAKEKLKKEKTGLERCIAQQLNVEADLKKKLDTEIAVSKDVTESLAKANLIIEQLKAKTQKYEVNDLKSKDKIEKLRAKLLRERQKIQLLKQSSEQSKSSIVRQNEKLKTKLKRNNNVTKVEFEEY